MMLGIDNLPHELLLGRQTENGVTVISIDVQCWLDQWPGMEIVIMATRPGESAAYPAATRMDGSSIVWTVNGADTAIAGRGTAEILGLVDGVRKLSQIVRTRIKPSTVATTMEPPDGAQPWVDKVLNAADEIKNMTAQAETLQPGDAATASYADGKLTLGIPRGLPGAKGDPGPNGDPGPKGDPGSDANVTAENIEAALGYVPAKISESTSWGIINNADGELALNPASNNTINSRLTRQPITVGNFDYAVKAAMCDGKGAAWTSAEQKAARERMGLDKSYELIEEIVLEEGVTQIVRSPLSFSCTSVLGCVTLPIMDSPIEFFMQVYTDTDISYTVGNVYGSKDGLVEVRFEEYIKNGVLTGTAQGRVHGWGGSPVYGVNNAATLVFCEALIGVRLYTPTSGRNIPAGTKIQIYGVRA